MAELAQNYGPLVYMQLGAIPVLVESSPQLMKEVLVTPDHIFGSRPQSTTVKRCFQKGRNGLATAELGNDYRTMRRLYTHKLQSPACKECRDEGHGAWVMGGFSRWQSSDEDSSEQTNFIDVLMNLANDGAQYMDHQLIKLLILEALLVGTDGMCNTIEWAMAGLLRHPIIMQKLQTEIDTIVGTSRMVEESDLPNLPDLQAIIKENFRLHPVGPILVPHEVIEATKIDGYDIPAPTRVFPNEWAMGRDPTVWDRPNEFDPDRFMNLTDVEKHDPKVKFGAFGSGRRGCPGMKGGTISVGLGIAHLAHCFDWSTHEVDITEKFDGAGFAMMKNPLSSLHIQAPRLPVSLFTA